MTYQEYLETAHWKKLRRKALERDCNRCVICNTTRNLRIHHRFYPTDLAATRVEHLTTLCAKHHDLFHEIEGRGSRGLVKPNRPDRSPKQLTNGEEEDAIVALLRGGEFTQQQVADELNLPIRVVWGWIGRLNDKGMLTRRNMSEKDKSKTTLWRWK